MSTYTDSASAQIAITTVNSILVISNIAGNSLVCIIIFKNRDMRTSFNYLLMNLAVADMTVAIFFVPRYIFIHTFTHPDGLSGTVLCRLLTAGNLAWIGGAASLFTLVTIAIERYHAVLYPYGNKGKLTNRKLKVIVPCSWVFGAILIVPEFLVMTFDNELDECIEMFPEEWMGKAYSSFWLLMCGIFPVVLMATVYSRVMYALWCKRQEPNAPNCRQQGVSKARKRVTLMALIVSVIFVVCWLDESITYVLIHYSSNHTLEDVTNAVANTMIQFNSAINPIVYALVNQKFREKMKKMMCCDCRSTNVHTFFYNGSTEE